MESFKTPASQCGNGAEPAYDTSEDREKEQMTCETLCSLMSSGNDRGESPTESSSQTCSQYLKSCPKQLQLPMFLSKTYHMIDRCDRCEADIAAWSVNGDNFVVKNLDKFASNVLPLYFKHSNFSSFARQLNFYGFRKLRSDPILTSDLDPQTSCFVRFYHENFQKNKPELLHEIKRATKSELQSKDDVESLKGEVMRLKEELQSATTDYDRRLAELSYDCARRISATNAELEKLQVMVTTLVAKKDGDGRVGAPAADLLQSLSQVAAVSLQNQQGLLAVANSSEKRSFNDVDIDNRVATKPRLD